MTEHIPVLLHEAITGLEARPGEVAVDATLGGGGHSSLLCQAVGEKGTLIAFDEDPEAFSRSKPILEQHECKKLFVHGNFRTMEARIQEKGIASADRILFDLGISSFHLEESGRGFSFKKKEPLLMTMGKTGNLTAYEIVNSWDENQLTEILRNYGEESFARPIAEALVESREKQQIENTEQLTEIITSALPTWYRKKKIHPATKTFQALRIAANDELGALLDGLRSAWNILSPGGRMAVISFHSLEDRIVKNFYKEKKADGTGTLITKKPIVPGEEELAKNPRSRSAKLRIIQKN